VASVTLALVVLNLSRPIVLDFVLYAFIWTYEVPLVALGRS